MIAAAAAQAGVVLACLPLLAAACAQDIRHRLIPDWTAVGLATVGLGAAALAGSVPSALTGGAAAGGIAVAAAVAGAWGWGDVKLLAASGTVAGLDRLPALLLAATMGGAALAVVLLTLRPWARAMGSAPPHWPRWARAELTRLRRAPSAPYAIAISGGLLAVL